LLTCVHRPKCLDLCVIPPPPHILQAHLVASF
jgi:hypothetical protein